MRTRLAFALSAAALSVSILAPPASADATVSMENLAFQPSTVTISVGESVTWVHNDGSVPHDVHALDGSFDSNPNCPQNPNTCMTEGDTYTQTFDSPGTVAYLCDVHGSAMSGTVVVQGDGGTAPPPGDGGTTPGELPSTGPAAPVLGVVAVGAILLVGGLALLWGVRRRA